MRCLLVHAHPLDKSLTRHFLDVAASTLEAAGHDVDSLDLYQAGFNPRLTAAERVTHYALPFDRSALTREIAQLEAAELLVLVFPTWWFGPPAILKGWIDRVFAPGVAYDPAPDLGPIQPRLHRLRQTVIVTTLGTPWWVDWLVLRRPVRRVFKTAILGACAPKARFDYLAFYAAETTDNARVKRFADQLEALLAKV